jgi:transcriptional regulator with XRE-family HTH domain
MLAVNPEQLGRIARRLRMRQRWTQVMLAARAGVSRRSVSKLECGGADGLRLRTITAVMSALGAHVNVRVSWNGPGLDRLLDEGHAAVGASVKRRLERWGWLVRAEVSYNHYGERGRIDLLAWHPICRVLLVIEIKTDLVDVQDLLGTLDAKARLARNVAERFAWEVRSVVPAIVFAEDRTTRNRLERVNDLFDRFALRGRAATTWMRNPDSAPSGVLWFTDAGAAIASRSDAPRVRPSTRTADSQTAPSRVH